MPIDADLPKLDAIAKAYASGQYARPAYEQVLKQEEMPQHQLKKKLKELGVTIGDYLSPKAYGAEASTLDKKIDSTTHWTPDKFRWFIADADKVTYVHFRKEGVGDNESGDDFLSYLMVNVPEIDNFVRIDIEDYSISEAKSLMGISARYNQAEGPIRLVPSGSVYKGGKEFRIRGPPTENFPKERLANSIKSFLAHN